MTFQNSKQQIQTNRISFESLQLHQRYVTERLLCISRVFIQKGIVNFSLEPVPYYNLTTACCKRSHFAFNGAECSAPLAIDGIVYMWLGNTQDLHRVRHIEGHCNNIHKGRVRVGFWVGNCQHGVAGDASTGWQSVSRIFIEEVPKAQSLP